MNSTDVVIQTNQLSKLYRSRKDQTLALSDLNLEVRRGEIFGYLGPNGAGKTTTIRLLLDFIRPTSGHALIFGKDVQAHSVELRRRIGFMPGELSLWSHLTGQQIVNYAGSSRGDTGSMAKQAHAIAERMQLDLTKRVHELSSGNKRTLGLVIAMMHTPDLLILDEPTSGLDPLLQQTFHEMVREAREAGRTIFLSSHILGEVQAICDRVGILRDGKLKAVERVDDLTHTNFTWVWFEFRDPITPAIVADVPAISDVTVEGKTLHLRLSGDWAPLLQAVNRQYVVKVRIKEPSLEEVFLTFYSGAEPAAKQAPKEAVS